MDTHKQHCINMDCKHYKLVSKGNITVHSRKQKRYRCKTCNKTWVSHIHSTHYQIKTEYSKMKRGLELLNHGISIRKTAKYLNVSPSTIQRWKNRISK